MITINRHLNLVIPIRRADETVMYVHSTPIRPETFEKYHMVMAKTFSSFAQNGLDPRSGPSVAALIMTDVAKSTTRAPGLNWWDGPDGVGGEAGLFADIRRLSNAIISNAGNDFGSMPFQQALDQGLLDDDEKREVMNMLAFFTVVSLVAPRTDRELLVKGMAAIYELQTTSSNATEFAASLKISTPDAIIGENAPA